MSEENKFDIVSIDTDSFINCISFVTNIDKNELTIDNEVEPNGNWYKPYTPSLYKNGYDMIFYSYRDTPIVLTDDSPLEKYSFPQLPLGTCILLCIDGAFNCHSVVAQSIHIPTEDDADFTKNLIVTYEPTPDRPKLWILEVGFFIKTFMVQPTKVE